MVETVGGPEAGYERVEVQLAAQGAQLTERERAVLRLRFEDDLKQREIGRRLGVSQMQVSRTMRTALRKILEAVQGDGLPGGRKFFRLSKSGVAVAPRDLSPAKAEAERLHSDDPVAGLRRRRG